MSRVPLDKNTADRLLAGAVAPEDAPPGYADVARLLEAASTEPTAEELADEGEMVAQMAAIVRSSPTDAAPEPRRRSKPVRRRRVAAALVAAGLACGAGLASAGALPGVVQDLASAALDKVGISIPDSDDDATADHRATAVTRSRAPKGRDVSAKANRAETPRSSAVSAAPGNVKGDSGRHGSASGPPAETVNSSEISRAVRQTPRSIVVPGATVSASASTNKGRAGQQRPAPTSRRPSAPPGRGRGAPDHPQKRRSGTGAQTTRTAARGAGATGSERARRGEQGPTERSAGQGTGRSGNPGTGGQGGEPANGGAGPGGTGNGDSGRNGRP